MYVCAFEIGEEVVSMHFSAKGVLWTAEGHIWEARCQEGSSVRISFHSTALAQSMDSTIEGGGLQKLRTWK